jgi:small redox-active disulfide protein 2
MAIIWESGLRGINMNIKVLGSGCIKCQTLDKLVREAVREMRIDAEIEYSQDKVKILDYNVKAFPALVINGIVKSAGRVLDKNEVKQMITDALNDGAK